MCIRSPAEFIVGVWAACLSAVLLGLSACHKDPVGSAQYELTYATPYVSSHPFSRADIRWMQFVEEHTAGRVHIKPYWGGALLSSDQSMIEIRHGVADIGLITPIYSRGGVHASRMQAGFYVGVKSIADQVMIFKCLSRDFPVFREEMTGLHLLALQGGNESGVLTRNRPVHSLADLRGLRLRAQSDSIPILRALGADPVDMPMREVYSAMSKGVIDGVVTPPDALSSMHFAEVGHYFSELRFSRGSYPARAMSEKVWERLPADVQAVLNESETVWEQALSEEITASLGVGYKIAATRGVQIIKVPPNQQRHFDELYEENSLIQARRLEDFGIDGVPIYREAQRLIHERASGQTFNCDSNEPASSGKDAT